MRAAPVITSPGSMDSMSVGACSIVDEHGKKTMAMHEKTASRPRCRDGLRCGDDTVLITHLDGRRFLNLEQRVERGLPTHIPKYDA